MLNLFQNSKAKKRNPYSQLKNGPNYKLTKLQGKIISPSLSKYIFLYKHFIILHTCIKHANILSRATSIKLIRLNTKALCIFFYRLYHLPLPHFPRLRVIHTFCMVVASSLLNLFELLYLKLVLSKWRCFIDVGTSLLLPLPLPPSHSRISHNSDFRIVRKSHLMPSFCFARSSGLVLQNIYIEVAIYVLCV